MNIYDLSKAIEAGRLPANTRLFVHPFGAAAPIPVSAIEIARVRVDPIDPRDECVIPDIELETVVVFHTPLEA